MTVLVTGGSGLVGSHVIAALRARSIPVRALSRARGGSAVRELGAEVVEGDVTDPAAWSRAAQGVRAIVHAAALVTQRRSFEDFVDVNVGGTRLAVATARAGGLRLVYLSSVAVYGRAARSRPGSVGIAEEFPFEPLPDADFYARSKRLAEQVVHEGAEHGGFTAVSLRPNVIYGEGDRLFTPRVIRVLRWGFVPLVGGGANHLACVYAGNVATAALAALEAPSNGFKAYNVTHDAPPPLTQREFFDAFGVELGVRLRHAPVPEALARMGVGLWTGAQRLLDRDGYAGVGRSAVSFLTRDNPYVASSAARELGWRPPFDTHAAIRRSVRWYRDHGS
ncbi:MAG TPA: NAD-dependent epimerase/dehydratase family protein [Gemmatimonadales bacterium]